MNINNLITVSLASLAFLSPIITAIINNVYTYKHKKVELYEKDKISKLNDFIEAYKNYFITQSETDFELFHLSVYSLYLYFKISDNLKNEFLKLEKIGCVDDLRKATRDIIYDLSKQLIKH